MKKISLIGILSLFLLLTKQLVATEHLVNKHLPSAHSPRDSTTEVFQFAANIEPSLLLAQADTNAQETTQAEFERRQKRIEELEATIQKRIEEAQPRQSVTEKSAPAKLDSTDSKSSVWKMLAILAVVLLGLLTLLRMWWQNRQEEAMEARAIQEAIEAADSDVSSSDMPDSPPSDKKSTKLDIVSTGNTEPEPEPEPESDPISAAAIFLAFEQRARAIQVLKDALISNPTQGDITNKLLTLYANDGNISAFTSLFESAADNIENEEQWAKIKSLAEATIPAHKIHAYDTNVSVPVLQDAIENQEVDSLNPDEFSISNTGEDTDPEIVIDEASISSDAQLSDSNLPEADASNQHESSAREKPTSVSQNDLKTTLALAKAYLDIENDEAAVGFLTDVISNDQGALGQEAQLLLDSLDKDLIDRAISKRPGISDSQPERSDQQAIIERAIVIEQDGETAGESLAGSSPTEADTDADDFDSILDEELAEVNIHDPETALTLAKAYIDLGEDDLARDFLMDASATENQQNKVEIKSLLEILDQKENDNTQEIEERPSPKEAPSDEISNTEEYKAAHQDNHETTDTPVDTVLGEHNDEIADEQDVPLKEDPDNAVQTKKQAPQKDSDADIGSTVQKIAKPSKATLETGSLLALAKSYIALEEYDLARDFLAQVIQTDDQADKPEAKIILSVIDEGGDLDFIFNFELLPDSVAYKEHTDFDDEAHDQHVRTENKSVEGDESGLKDTQKHDSIGTHIKDESEIKIEYPNIPEKDKPEEDSLLDSPTTSDDQTSTTETFATVDANLEDLALKDIPEYRPVDTEDPIKEYDVDQESEIVELGPHDAETALELAKAYIELGDEKTARKVLIEVTRSDKKKCILQARSILASLDSNTEGGAIVDQIPAVDNDFELAKEANDIGRYSKGIRNNDTKAVASAESSSEPTEEDESILIETEQHDPETAIELAYAYIELGETKIAKNILRDIIEMATSSENIKVKAKAALSSLT